MRENSSLVDLYDELTMSKELRKAHQENDKAVMEAYGFDWKKMTESDCVAEPMKMYEILIKDDENEKKLYLKICINFLHYNSTLFNYGFF